MRDLLAAGHLFFLIVLVAIATCVSMGLPFNDKCATFACSAIAYICFERIVSFVILKRD